MTTPSKTAIEAVRNAIGNAIFDTVESDVLACALTTSELVIIAQAAIAAMHPESAAKPDQVALDQCVMVCPRCEGEGCHLDDMDEAACFTDCARCGGNGWIVDAQAAIAAMTKNHITILSTRSEPPSLFDVWLTLKAWWQGVGVPLRLYLETMTPLFIMAMQVRTENAATRATKDAIRKDRLVPQR